MPAACRLHALAGTGKTTTLLGVVAKYPAKRILYLAFNRSIADETAGLFRQHRLSHAEAM